MLCPPMLVAILGYFGAHFGECFSFFENHLIFFHKILYIFSWYYSDDHYMKNSFSCYVLLCWWPFWGILGAYFGVWSFISWELCNIFSWNFVQISKNFMAPFYGRSSTRVLKLVYVAYVHTSTFIGVRMILDICTLTRMLIFSLWFFKVFKYFLVLIILYYLETSYCNKIETHNDLFHKRTVHHLVS